MGFHLCLSGGAGPAGEEQDRALSPERQVADKEQPPRFISTQAAFFLKSSESPNRRGGAEGRAPAEAASGPSLPHVWPLVFWTKPADYGLIMEIRESESDKIRAKQLPEAHSRSDEQDRLNGMGIIPQECVYLCPSSHTRLRPASFQMTCG